MLDLTKLAQQLQGLSQHLSQEATAAQKRLDLALRYLQHASDRQTQLVQTHQDWRDRLAFVAAVPVEPLTTQVAIPPPPPRHTVIATDGSQIAPSHHEIAYCYLLNIGRVALHYGQNRQPLLDSLPEVFYRAEDLYPSRQWGIRTEEWMGHRRTVLEITVLAELATALTENTQQENTQQLEASERCIPPERDRQAAPPATASVSPTSPATTLPRLAMVDGSLIYWFLDPLPAEARALILPPILRAWEQIHQHRVPLIGYLSASRSGESANFLRLQACPYPSPDCFKHCYHEVESANHANRARAASPQEHRAGSLQTHRQLALPLKQDPPCHCFDPLRDTVLWAARLQPGQRGPLWRSSARILEQYGAQTIYFCYVHVGTEIARIECPAWVAEDAELFNSALSLTIAQVQKGYGYPVALAEAHNQAVVRGGDRSRFFALLEQEMIRAGLKNVGTSYKEARKRGSIA
ncbi:DNA double-strand break repair nuclease NurA [Trichothermofontia sp.]